MVAARRQEHLISRDIHHGAVVQAINQSVGMLILTATGAGLLLTAGLMLHSSRPLGGPSGRSPDGLCQVRLSSLPLRRRAESALGLHRHPDTRLRASGGDPGACVGSLQHPCRSEPGVPWSWSTVEPMPEGFRPPSYGLVDELGAPTRPWPSLTTPQLSSPQRNWPPWPPTREHLALG